MLLCLCVSMFVCWDSDPFCLADHTPEADMEGRVGTVRTTLKRFLYTSTVDIINTHTFNHIRSSMCLFQRFAYSTARCICECLCCARAPSSPVLLLLLQQLPLVALSIPLAAEDFSVPSVE